jgi:hypothetical protein
MLNLRPRNVPRGVLTATDSQGDKGYVRFLSQLSSDAFTQ